MTDSVQLKRSLSLPLVTFYGLGTIVGAGIYVLIGKVAGQAGIYAPLSFAVAALVAALSALAYAELSARYPKSAGEAVYVQEGLGRRPLSMTVGFLIIVVGMVSTATMANGLVGYVQVFAPVPPWLVIVVLVAGLALLAGWGTTQSVAAAAIMTAVEVFGLLLVLWVAGDSFADLPARLPEFAPPAEAAVWSGILLGGFLAFYAFIGFEDMVNVAEEIKNPTRNLPLAIIIVLFLTMALYLSVSLVAVLAVPAAELADSNAPLALVYERSTGSPPTLVGLISIFSILNGALIQIIMASRILYGMSRQGWLPPSLGRVDPRTRTPLVATVLIAAGILALALWLPLVTLARMTNFVTLTVFALISAALWRIKGRDPHPPGIRTYPRWIPAAGAVANLGLIAFQAIDLIRG